MFFLLRSAFWIGLVLLLLPIDLGPKTEDTPPGVSPVAAFIAAQSTISDISGFCARNPMTCETGGQALAQIGAKAKVSAGALYDFIDQQQAMNSESGLTTGATGTLTQADLEPDWALDLPEEMPSASRRVIVDTPPETAVPRPNPFRSKPNA